MNPVTILNYDWLNASVTALQYICAVAFMFFGWRRAHQVRLYLKRSKERKLRLESPPPPPTRASVQALASKVCIQLPIYNEPDVVDELLDKVTRIRWPRQNLEIQVLDDSTDETTQLIKDWVAANPKLSAEIVHVRRPTREGYKAGNLVYGMDRSDADFFVIFDADFRPNPDYLERMMPLFREDNICAVQARWEFMNRNKSWVTLLQAVMLDPHFHIEQTVRSENNYFVTFNGTAGIWRRKAIEDAGGWSYDTVTEDLDLCFRAQMKGWRVHYESSYAVPSELPPTMTAFKAQQMRWTRGTVQVFRKLMGNVLRCDKPFKTKLEATHHLGIGFFHPLLAIANITNLPHVMSQLRSPDMTLGLLQLAMFLITCTSTLAYCLMGNYAEYKSKRRVILYALVAPIQFAIGFAFSLTTGLAALQGLFRKGGEFVRTPKGSLAKATTATLLNKAKLQNLVVLAAELGVGGANLYYGIRLFQYGYQGAGFFMTLQGFGLLVLAYTTIRERWFTPQRDETFVPRAPAEKELVQS